MIMSIDDATSAPLKSAVSLLANVGIMISPFLDLGVSKRPCNKQHDIATKSASCGIVGAAEASCKCLLFQLLFQADPGCIGMLFQAFSPPPRALLIPVASILLHVNFDRQRANMQSECHFDCRYEPCASWSGKVLDP